MSAMLMRSSKAAVATKRSATKARAEKMSAPEWVPKEAAPFVTPALEFLTADDFDIKTTPLYAKAAPYLENEWVVKSTGFKAIPELINGRAAMLGFAAAAGAEIFGRGSFLAQLSTVPQVPLLVLALVTVGTIVPIAKFPQATQGDYLQSLRELYTLPEGVFTEPMELLHGRLAMAGLAGLIAIELIKGSAVL